MGYEDIKEIEQTIYFLHEFQINIIVFGFQLGDQHSLILADRERQEAEKQNTIIKKLTERKKSGSSSKRRKKSK